MCTHDCPTAGQLGAKLLATCWGESLQTALLSSITALLRLYEGSIKALLRLYEGSIKALTCGAVCGKQLAILADTPRGDGRDLSAPFLLLQSTEH